MRKGGWLAALWKGEKMKAGSPAWKSMAAGWAEAARSTTAWLACWPGGRQRAAASWAVTAASKNAAAFLSQSEWKVGE